MLESKEDCIDEYQPSDHAKYHETIAKGRLIEVEDLAGVEVELLHEEEGDVHDDVGADEDGQLDAARLPQLGSSNSVALIKIRSEKETLLSFHLC